LKRLGLDHVDVLYLHCQSAREGVLHEALLKALEKPSRQARRAFPRRVDP